MTKLIACSNDTAEVGEYSEGTIWNPWEGRYVSVALRVLRICTEQEYLDFCDANDLPVRHDLLSNAPHYYEIELLD